MDSATATDLVDSTPSEWGPYPDAVQELVRWFLSGVDRDGNAAHPTVALASATGAFGYVAGTSGTPALPRGARVTSIAALADTAADARLTINGGDVVTIKAGSPFSLDPATDLVAPTLVFTGTSTYFVEYVV